MRVSFEVDALLSGLPFQHSSAQSYLEDACMGVSVNLLYIFR